jgi:DNA ligase D-like protein (predicted ligase)
VKSRPQARLPFRQPTFIDLMQCLAVSQIPVGPQWTWEIKLDGYRCEAVKAVNKITLYSRLENSLNEKHPYIVAALKDLPNNTVIDGELVALDDEGRASFNLMQNVKSAADRIRYYVFDIMVLKGRDLTRLPLSERRKILKSEIKLKDKRVALVEHVAGESDKVLMAARQNRLEGIIGKRTDSFYEIGERSGSWVQHRINAGQEFVIGGFTTGGRGFDELVIGYYDGQNLRFVAKVRNGFNTIERRKITEKLKPLVTHKCPFVNLPEKRAGRWGAGLTADKMKECVWLKPKLVGQFEFLEWTGKDHLRHAKFVGMRDDKLAKQVRKES